MILPRRTILGAALIPATLVPAALVGPSLVPAARAQAMPKIRVGTLRFGTVSWEVDTIRRHGLDARHGVAVEETSLAAPQAAQVALQAGNVDAIVADWLLVARLRGTGADFAFVPFSNAVGALIAPAGSPVRSVRDLPGRSLGIAGTPLDKSWLILRAHALQAYGIDLDGTVRKSFGPPPLLAEQMKQGRLEALLTFWPYAAKAEAGGASRVLSVEDAVAALGVPAGVPYIGYTFSEAWAGRNPAAINGFLAASRAARAILAADDQEWQRIRPLTGAADDAELLNLRDWYRQGIPGAWGPAQRDAAAALFAILARTGGKDLTGPIDAIPDGTFWPVGW
jgi:NitT/TauT family transport system substrate-binding protein